MTNSLLPNASRLAACSALVLSAAFLALPAWSQSGPTEGTANGSPREGPLPPGVAAKSAAVQAAKEAQGNPVNKALRVGEPLSVREGLVTQAGTGRPVSEGSRVLRLPGKCSPKTGSLDCVAEAGQAQTGANVSTRVRNSVIGEVGAGKGATEGGGTVKRKETCTPQPGKLTCD